MKPSALAASRKVQECPVHTELLATLAAALFSNPQILFSSLYLPFILPFLLLPPAYLCVFLSILPVVNT